VECGFGIDPFVDDSGGYVRLEMTRVSALDTTDRVKTDGGSGFVNEVDCRMVLLEKEW
jgi:hypothetical protein